METSVAPDSIAPTMALSTILNTADEPLVSMWCHGRSPHKQRAFAVESARFRAYLGKPLAAATLGDLQAFADCLGALALASRARALAAVKSQLSFGNRLGVLPVDVGKPVLLPAPKN